MSPKQIFLALLGFVTIVAGQDRRLGISVDVPSVSLQVMVHDEAGRAITNLTQRDFDLYENGERQEFQAFVPPGSALSVFMLIDPIWFESGQLAAIEAFAKTLRPQDRIAIASLDKFKMLMNWRTVQSFRLQDVSTPSIGKPEFTPTTNLYDGLEEASRKFQNERGRKAIVVITHGRDREIMQQTLQLGSPLEIEDDKDFAKHLQALQRAKIPIHVIAKTQVELEEGKLHGPWFWYSETVMAAFLKGAQSRMETLAEQTGGRIIFPKSIAWSATTAQLRFEFEPIFRNVGLELGISYTLSYTPRNNQSDGTRRVIEVRATGGRVTQSRTEYTAR